MSDSRRQTQFLTVLDRDEATRRFREAVVATPRGTETVELAESVGRVLAEDIRCGIDVTAFDRSNVDGFAVIAADTCGATEETPVQLALNSEHLTPGLPPAQTVTRGHATAIATGAMLPRGADAVVMIEDTDLVDADSNAPRVRITRSVAPGQAVSFAGADISMGETVLRERDFLTSREVGVLAAMGVDRVPVLRRPRVGIISTGNEIVPPGTPLPPGCVYDSNQAILTAAVRELGGEPVPLGVVRDDLMQLRQAMHRGADCDVLVLSGGTSKGKGDLCYQVVAELQNPGIVAHGVALKPGKPVCLAAEHGRPIVVLPGFPTSAVFTFHEFVAPVILSMAGRQPGPRATTSARLATRVNSDRGRTEYLLVHLIENQEQLIAYPMGKGSGSVTAFSMADGFVTIDQHTELVPAREIVRVTLLSESVRRPDFVSVGSHCIGLDFLLSELQRRGFSTRSLFVGSLAGVEAAARGECDVAGTHLLDPETESYNNPWLTDAMVLLPGYRRPQGLVFRRDDSRFSRCATPEEVVRAALGDPECHIVNRNRGSGTRILIDGLLGDTRPAGYATQTRSHNAVCASVAQGRADWGVAIRPVAIEYGLQFVPLRDEEFDFVVPRCRLDRPSVRAFRDLLLDPDVRRHLQSLGFEPAPAATLDSA